MIEREVEYAAAALLKMQREQLKSIEVKREAVEQYLEVTSLYSTISADADKWYTGIFPRGRCRYIDTRVTLLMKIRLCIVLNADHGTKWVGKKVVSSGCGPARACTQRAPLSIPAGRIIITSILTASEIGFIGSATVRPTTRSTGLEIVRLLEYRDVVCSRSANLHTGAWYVRDEELDYPPGMWYACI